MSSKLNRDEILREILSTLIKGWGRKAIYDALDNLEEGAKTKGPDDGQAGNAKSNESKAVQIVEGLAIPEERKILMLQLATAYDAGAAFPKLSDIKAFLSSHHQKTSELRSRDQAFRKIVPILQRMSEKGLLKVISHSHHSGPVELGSISDAIKGAGQDMRGPLAEDDNKPS